MKPTLALPEKIDGPMVAISLSGNRLVRRGLEASRATNFRMVRFVDRDFRRHQTIGGGRYCQCDQTLGPLIPPLGFRLDFIPPLGFRLDCRTCFPSDLQRYSDVLKEIYTPERIAEIYSPRSLDILRRERGIFE